MLTGKPVALRTIQTGKEWNDSYSSEDSIAALQLAQPEDISTVLTYNLGKDDDRFPLSFLTEGQGKVGVRDINKVEWRWPVMGRMTFNDYVTHFGNDDSDIIPDNVGRGAAPFTLHFRTHKIIEQYGLMAPDNTTGVRVMKDLGATAWGFGYILQLVNPDPNASVNPEFLAPDMSWTMTAPTVTESYSKGNRSNTYGPGKMRNQLQFNRFSKEIGGNLANTIVQYQFQESGKGTTNLWMNEEMRQFEVMQRMMLEEELWLSTYNRNLNGDIPLKDFDNGKSIPHTTGMFEVCRENNYDTYGEVLPLQKIIRTIGDVLTNDSDTGKMDVIIAGGRGFLSDFSEGILADARHQGFLERIGETWIKEHGDGGGLTYGNSFTRFKTPDGHMVSTAHLAFLDKGTLADNDKANGYIHPRTGYPMSSHQGVAIDFSQYNGEQNVVMVRMKGQVDLTGVLKGLTPIPPSWGGGAVTDNRISTEIDKSRYEKKTSRGLQVFDGSHFFMLKCVL